MKVSDQEHHSESTSPRALQVHGTTLEEVRIFEHVDAGVNDEL